MRPACMLICAAALAAPAQDLGNPARLLPRGGLAVGLQGAWLVHQDLARYDLATAYSDGYADTSSQKEHFRNDRSLLATVAYGLGDRVTVFAGAGTTGRGSWESEAESESDWRATLRPRFLWSAGLKVQVLGDPGAPGLLLSAGWQRSTGRRAGDWVRMETGERAEDLGWTTEDRVDQDLLTTAATWVQPLGRWTPYAGLGWHRSRFTQRGTWTVTELPWSYLDYTGRGEAERGLSLLAGADLDLGRGWTLNLQGAWLKRRTFTAGISHRFQAP